MTALDTTRSVGLAALAGLLLTQVACRCDPGLPGTDAGPLGEDTARPDAADPDDGDVDPEPEDPEPEDPEPEDPEGDAILAQADSLGRAPVLVHVEWVTVISLDDLEKELSYVGAEVVWRFGELLPDTWVVRDFLVEKLEYFRGLGVGFEADWPVRAALGDVPSAIRAGNVNLPLHGIDPMQAGAGVLVCLIDTGMAGAGFPVGQGFAHRAVWKQRNFVDDLQLDVADDNGHGTALAGIVAAREVFEPVEADGAPGFRTAHGVAPGAKLAIAKVLDANGQGLTSDVIRGLEWCATLEQGGNETAHTRVALLGLTADRTSPGDCTWGRRQYRTIHDGQGVASYESLSHLIDTLARPQEHPEAHAVLTIAAAGNSDQAPLGGEVGVGDGDDPAAGALPPGIAMPACANRAVAVGAVYERDNPVEPAPARDCPDAHVGEVACFSRQGPTLDLVAPGAVITTSGLEHGEGLAQQVAGTSAAAAVVAGVAAILLGEHPELTPEDVRRALWHSRANGPSWDLGSLEFDDEYGHGSVNAAKVLSYLEAKPIRCEADADCGEPLEACGERRCVDGWCTEYAGCNDLDATTRDACGAGDRCSHTPVRRGGRFDDNTGCGAAEDDACYGRRPVLEQGSCPTTWQDAALHVVGYEPGLEAVMAFGRRNSRHDGSECNIDRRYGGDEVLFRVWLDPAQPVQVRTDKAGDAHPDWKTVTYVLAGEHAWSDEEPTRCLAFYDDSDLGGRTTFPFVAPEPGWYYVVVDSPGRPRVDGGRLTVHIDPVCFPEQEGRPCDDGNACTVRDTCVRNAGAGGAGVVCRGEDPGCPPHECVNRHWDPDDGCVDVPAPEECDGVDNDCDGLTDESEAGEPLTRACYSGPDGTREHGACREGTETCLDAEWSGVCVGEVVPRQETCNLVDDDCDGSVDDWVGRDCMRWFGFCHTEGVQVCSDQGERVCNAPDHELSPEECNGEDDDCDGDTDEDVLGDSCYTGPDGSLRGACAPGVRACHDGHFATDEELVGDPGLCLGQVLPGPEVCNGEDDDCDGLANEGPDGATLTRPCPYAGPEGTEGVGVCRVATEACWGGRWSGCEGEVLPLDHEECNGLDDDCDGAADEEEDLRSVPSGPGVCAVVEQRCEVRDGGKEWVVPDLGAILGDVYEPGDEETCDALDNDCDGEIDEGIEQPCGTDEGECVPGRRVCAAGGWGACIGGIHPVAEDCNGLDDDCDGQVDERRELRPPPAGPGVCAVVEQLCVEVDGGKRWAAPDDLEAILGEVYEPGDEETCDDLDNDCDGEVDEGIEEPCGTDEGECVAGRQVCAAGGWGLCIDEVRPEPEDCNGLDDDCDGETDEEEDLRPPPAGLGVCARVDQLCVERDGRRQWVVPDLDAHLGEDYEPDGETRCDGLDNDCDGGEDWSNGVTVTKPCYTGPEWAENVGICSRGAEDCDYEHVFHVWSGDCIGDVMPLGRDVCNGLDDDCDDETDEDDTFAGDLTGRWAVRSGRTGAGSGSVSAQCGQDGVRGAGKPERWFQFDVVGGPRNLVARVFGSRFDALLYLRPGTCDNVPQDAEDPLVPADDGSLCVDDGGLGEPEELRVEDLPVGSYVLFVDGGSEQMDAFPHSGEFTLWLTLRDPAEPFPPALPDNDTCADITVAPAAPQYHEYFELRPGLTFHGDTRDATNASWLPDEPACTPDEPPGGETGRDRVYWFHREVGDPWWRLVLDVQMIDDVAFDASLYVRQGLCSNGALYRACDFTGGQDPNLRRRRYVSPPQVPVAGDYFVFVDAKGPVAGEEPGDEHLPGPFALRLEEPCGGEAAENRCSEEQECDAGRRSCYLPGHGVCAEPSQSSGRVYDTAAGGGVDRSHLYACLGCQRADDCWPDEECRQIVHVDSVEPGIVDVNNACVRPCASDGDCLRGRVCCQPFDAEECQAGGADGRCACANGMAGACIPERIRDWDD